jgi:hypothetical protein
VCVETEFVVIDMTSASGKRRLQNNHSNLDSNLDSTQTDHTRTTVAARRWSRFTQLQIHHDLPSRTHARSTRTSDVRRGDVDVASARHSDDRADIVLLGS